DNQRVWWDSLFTQHCAAQSVDNLIHLVNAFKEFSRKIAECGYEFYLPCEFKDVNSLPVALSTILNVMEHCSPQDKLSQWKTISSGDFSSTGIQKAKNEGRWAYYNLQQKITLAYID